MSIEQRAQEYVNAPCDWKCENCHTDIIECRFYNEKEAFKAGIDEEQQNKAREKGREIADFNVYYIMPADVEYRICEALKLAIAMAKASYPHLVGELECAQTRYRDTLEVFKGSHNKPISKAAYLKK